MYTLPAGLNDDLVMGGLFYDLRRMIIIGPASAVLRIAEAAGLHICSVYIERQNGAGERIQCFFCFGGTDDDRDPRVPEHAAAAFFQCEKTGVGRGTGRQSGYGLSVKRKQQPGSNPFQPAAQISPALDLAYGILPRFRLHGADPSVFETFRE